MPKKANTLERQILQELAYRAVFKYPVSAHQILCFLNQTNEIKLQNIEKTLGKLIVSKKIRKIGKRYILQGVKQVNYEQNKKTAKKILKESKNTLLLLSKIPFIEFIGVTGSVSALNAKKGDDLDIFIITKDKRLWLARFFVSVVLIILKKYPNKKSLANKICPNIYITLSNMSWKTNNRNIYVAHDLMQMIPIYSKNNAYFKFLYQNKWVKGYFSSIEIQKVSLDETFKQSKFITILEKLAMLLQIYYMKNKITSEIVEDSFIHFNKNDSTKPILKKYKENLIN